jgi:hypothetical protein
MARMNPDTYREVAGEDIGQIVIERREIIGVVHIAANGPGHAITEAFKIVGDAIAEADTDEPMQFQFEAFGRTYRASQNYDG